MSIRSKINQARSNEKAAHRLKENANSFGKQVATEIENIRKRISRDLPGDTSTWMQKTRDNLEGDFRVGITRTWSYGFLYRKKYHQCLISCRVYGLTQNHLEGSPVAANFVWERQDIDGHTPFTNESLQTSWNSVASLTELTSKVPADDLETVCAEMFVASEGRFQNWLEIERATR